jgi:hypothetical protein
MAAVGVSCVERNPAWNSPDFRLYDWNTIGQERMASKSQREATPMHRRRLAARGLVRVQVQVLRRDAGLIRAVRGETGKPQALRSALAKVIMNPEIKTAFDIFGSELPDEAFAGVFGQPR